MAPSPDNDKAPDKSDKNKEEKSKDSSKESQKDEKKFLNLNDRELKALLDEAINYKNPKDREGKSELFNDLLLEAEETERIARATSAGGSELVRHCNPAARRQRHNNGGCGTKTGRRYGALANSGIDVSERATHGGSLDNLAKEDLYEVTCRRLRGNRSHVSTRPRQGGSLPCNVNAGDAAREFLEEAKRNKEMREKESAFVDVEAERLIENDLQARGYEERLIDMGGATRLNAAIHGESSGLSATSSGAPKYTSKATLHIQSNRASSVDDPLPLDHLEGGPSEKKTVETNPLSKLVPSKYQVIFPTVTSKTSGVEEKFFYFQKVDENGNALHQTKEKKKKKQSDKNVVVLKSENIEGHKFEIIDNVDQLLHYIEGTTDNNTNAKPRTVQSSKSRHQLHKQHASEDGGSKTGKKRHSKSGAKDASAGVTGDGRHELKKSNSLGEISGMKLDREFEPFGQKGKLEKEEEVESVVLRGSKPATDRARERRSWGNVEPPTFQNLYNASSLETLETSANWEVTRPKKRSKKRRNSVSSASGVRQNSSASGVSSTISSEDRKLRRAPSPEVGAATSGDPRPKTDQSRQHSAKSYDSSSDVDSVHSLPMDGPISYADIAKNSEKKKPSPEKQDRPVTIAKEKSPVSLKPPDSEQKPPSSPVAISPPEKIPGTTSSTTGAVKSAAVPDVHNIKSFPAITKSSNAASTSDKAVQSTLPYEETATKDKSPVAEAPPQQATTVSAQATPLATNAPPPVANHAVKTKSKGSKDAGRANRPEAGGLQANSVQGFFGAQGDIQNELSMLGKDPAQYAVQRMPPDIVDVSTIEKMHFMNYAGAGNVGPIPAPPVAAQTIPQVPYAQPPSGPVYPQAVPHPGKGKRRKGVNASRVVDARAEGVAGDAASTVCDSNVDDRAGASRMVNGTSEESHTSADPVQEPSGRSSPPVVIMSGQSKEVPLGLVFGFDVNEQLLQEDSGGGGDAIFREAADNDNCPRLVRIDRVPKPGGGTHLVATYTGPPRVPANYNHEKTVSFIAAAWEAAVNDPNTKYYSEDL